MLYIVYDNGQQSLGVLAQTRFAKPSSGWLVSFVRVNMPFNKRFVATHKWYLCYGFRCLTDIIYAFALDGTVLVKLQDMSDVEWLIVFYLVLFIFSFNKTFGP